MTHDQPIVLAGIHADSRRKNGLPTAKADRERKTPFSDGKFDAPLILTITWT
jgi:hypothetical protein